MNPLKGMVVVVLLLAAGCGGSTPGSASPTSSTATPPAKRDYGAPAFEQVPLNGFPPSPCQLVKPKQWAANGLTGKKRSNSNSAGRSCEKATDDGFSRYVSIRILDSPSGLRGLFSRKDQFPVFYQESVSNYHAVVFQNAKGDSMCRTTVMVNPETLLAASASVHKQREKYDPCALTKKFAEYAVENLKEQG